MKTPLLENEIRQELNLLSGWEIKNGRLFKQYRFEGFLKAMLFVNKTINPIQEHYHFPKIEVAYNQVSLSLFTVEIGALSKKDFVLAKAFDELV